MTSTERLSAALSDRYTIERELGEGGMATVFLAEDIKHHRKVAIKLLKPELAAVLGAERFVQEITTTAALQHPHILPLFDSGEADGFLYYVMPFIDGETLRDKLSRETQFGIDEAVKITTEIADALHYAHSQGVVHRDIKPENILLANGRPMVADFGIALAVSAAAGGRMTETGLSLGTPHYMSPEQATAEKEITARSDVYSLGSMLYEMLAGEPPHLGGSAQQIIMKIIAEEAQPLGSLRKSVPANVTAAVAKSLEKLPADRFQSAEQFAVALTDSGFTTARLAHTEGAAGTAMDWVRDPRTWAVAVVALLAVGWGATRPSGSGGPSEYDIGLPDSAGMSAALSIGFDADPQGDFVVYQTSSEANSQLWYRSLTDATTRRIEGTDGGVRPTISPDGTEVAFLRLSREGWTLETISVGGGETVELATGADEVSDLDWLDDGRIQLLEGDGKLARWVDPGGGSSTTSPINYCIMAQVLSESGRMLCGGGGGKFGYTIDVSDIETEDPLWRRTIDSTLVYGSHFRLVEGGYLTYLSAGGDLLAAPVDLESGEVGNAVRMVTGLARRNYSGAGTYQLTETGSLVFGLGRDAAVGHLVLADDSGVDTLEVGTEPFLRFALSPDGQTLATVVEVLEGEELRIYDLASGRHSVWATRDEIRQPVWSPSGDRLVFTRDDTLFVGSPSSGVPPEPVVSLGGNFEVYSWLAENRLVGVLWDDYTNAMVNIGVNPATVDSLVSDASFVRVSPSSDWIAYNNGAITSLWVEPLPTDGRRFQVAPNSIGEPLWISDSKLAFSVYGDAGTTLDYVDFDSEAQAPIGRRQEWLQLPGFRDTAGQSINTSPDGRVLYVQGIEEGPTRFLRVIPDWVERMKRAVDDAN